MSSSGSSASCELDIASERAIHYLQKQRGYRYLEHMAKGSYGVVVTMYDDKRSTPIAVKCAIDPADKELKAWPTFRHPNVVPLLEIILLDCCAVFVMPLYRKDLWMIADSDDFYKDPMSFDICRVWLKDVLRGLAYLHEKELAHLDLKMDNVFVKDNGHVCLGDYSLMAPVDEVTVGFLFLEHYQPPEFTPDYEELTNIKQEDAILRGDTADMWEFGIFALDLFTNRKITIEKNSDYEVWKYDVFPFIQKIIKNKKYLKHTMKNCFTSKTFTKEEINFCEDFLNQILIMMPSKRLSAREALSHPFVKIEWPSFPKPDAPTAVLLEKDEIHGGLRQSVVEVKHATGTKRVSIRTALEAMMIREESSPEDMIRKELPRAAYLDLAGTDTVMQDIQKVALPVTQDLKKLPIPKIKNDKKKPIANVQDIKKNVPKPIMQRGNGNGGLGPSHLQKGTFGTTVKKDPELIPRKKKLKKKRKKLDGAVAGNIAIEQKPNH